MRLSDGAISRAALSTVRRVDVVAAVENAFSDRWLGKYSTQLLLLHNKPRIEWGHIFLINRYIGAVFLLVVAFHARQVESEMKTTLNK